VANFLMPHRCHQFFEQPHGAQQTDGVAELDFLPQALDIEPPLARTLLSALSGTLPL
jgi:hypothetical protein